MTIQSRFLESVDMKGVFIIILLHISTLQFCTQFIRIGGSNLHLVGPLLYYVDETTGRAWRCSTVWNCCSKFSNYRVWNRNLMDGSRFLGHRSDDCFYFNHKICMQRSYT
ncbi:hypothetical protein ACS0TY_028070 [Phlomoides rotata]